MSEDRIAATSRYNTVEQSTLEIRKGVQIVYLKRRIISGDEGVEIARHVVTEGDRPDIIATKELGDPEQYWRLCDSNGILHPRDLTAQVGAVIRITFSGGSDV